MKCAVWVCVGGGMAPKCIVFWVIKTSKIPSRNQKCQVCTVEDCVIDVIYYYSSDLVDLVTTFSKFKSFI